jgi:hypothetical protein
MLRAKAQALENSGINLVDGVGCAFCGLFKQVKRDYEYQ